MRVVEIQEVKNLSLTTKTIFFKDKFCAKAKAGQYIMVWIPGVDEIPLSLSSISSDKETLSVTVLEVGEATKALNQKKIGDFIGIRGPFGNHFRVIGKKVIVVGGGIGMSPLMPLIEEIKKKLEVTVLYGAKTQNELVFLDWLKKISNDINEIIITTDDGSCGKKCFITDVLKNILSIKEFNTICACGPEKMMYQTYLISEQYKIPLQVSLERMMRCAIGICGSCIIGKYRVCSDGPIFDTKRLREVKKEFGRIKHDLDGGKVPI